MAWSKTSNYTIELYLISASVVSCHGILSADMQCVDMSPNLPGYIF